MPRLLDSIDSPADLKKLAPEQLGRLAVEIRDELVSRVTANGGHLASSLGVVELTIALHRVFDSPVDKIIWDVGHQSYAHKLLTGRRQRFDSLRQEDGLSGFTSRDESPHDPFGAGHASTSISAAMGIATARDLSGDSYHVLAVIGDGAIAGGMAFEAVNHIGHKGTRLIVILNDNGMAISPSTGAFSRLLNQVRFDRRYEFAKRGARQTITRLPFGKPAWSAFKRLKGLFEKSMLPGAFWEELGFIYLGPVDGHNIKELEAALSRAKEFEQRPTLIHVMTQKGRGYAAAEADAVKFHGISPRPAEPQTAPSCTYSQVFGRTVSELMRHDRHIVAITAAMLDGTGLAETARQFPERVFDVGICEQHAVTFAAGLAAQGYKPIVAVYSTFMQRAFDQMVHDVCLQRLPVVFAIDRGGIVGDDGKTHQGTLDLSYLSLIPEMVVAAPKDENELRHLLYTAVASGRPMAVRYPRGPVPGVELDSRLHQIPIGQSELLVTGADLCIVATGATVAPALEAARQLSQEGFATGVINCRFISPLDSGPILEAARQTNRLITVEENVLSGGLGSRIDTLLAGSGMGRVQMVNIAIPDVFVAHGSQAALRARFHLDAPGILARARNMLLPEENDAELLGLDYKQLI